MAGNTEEYLDKILKSLDKLEYIKSADIPNIDLYMDQVTTFMDTRLREGVRNPGEDKILTKTMINNYAKNDLLPPPVKKKYSKEHVLRVLLSRRSTKLRANSLSGRRQRSTTSL